MSRKVPSRRFFAARADVADAFVKLASTKNLTLFGLVSDIMKKIVDLDRMGVSLEEAIDGFHLFKTAKEIGFVTVPVDLWYEAIENSLKTDRKVIETRFADAGEWIGKYALAKSQGNDPTRYLASYLAPLTSDAVEFSVEGSETMHLRCVNPRHSASYTELFCTLLVKAIETLGYQCEDRSVSKGMVLLTFHKLPTSDTKMRGEILA